MSEQKFKTGDVVYLKSGGPKMTITTYEPVDGVDVICTWFNNNELIEKSFNQEVLKVYEVQAPVIISQRRSDFHY